MSGWEGWGPGSGPFSAGADRRRSVPFLTLGPCIIQAAQSTNSRQSTAVPHLLPRFKVKSLDRWQWVINQHVATLCPAYVLETAALSRQSMQ